MPERLPDEYVAKAVQDARRFQGCWDAGTSGVLAAHTYRLAKEREGLLSTIKELEERNAALRAAVSERLQRTPAGDPKMIGYQPAPAVSAAGLPPDVPAEFLAANEGRSFRPAAPMQKADFSTPTLLSSSVPPVALDAAWGAVKLRAGASPRRPCLPCGERSAVPALIGITGRAGAGKNLVASMVPDASIVQLADTLYAMLSVMLGVTVDRLRDRDVKETAVGWLGKSPRELLQTLGTEWGRGCVRQDVWVLVTAKRIDELLEENASPVVVCDVRFDNEAEMIRGRGGRIWEVVRPGGSGPSTHASEAGISRHLVDLTLNNTGTIEHLRADVLSACGQLAR